MKTLEQIQRGLRRRGFRVTLPELARIMASLEARGYVEEVRSAPQWVTRRRRRK